MANIFSLKTNDFKRIYIYSDSVTTNTDYPVLRHFIDGQLFKTYTYQGVDYTINNTLYQPSPNVANLDYELTTTAFGDYNVFEINSITLDVSLSELDILENGIHSFLLISAGTDEIFLQTGQHIHKDLDCCVAKKIDKGINKNTGCNLENSLEDVKKVFTLLESINASLREFEFVNARQKRELALLICNSNCKCNCS
jgi:hypothetical protein